MDSQDIPIPLLSKNHMNPFRRLPIEVIHEIALLFPTDLDIVNFSLCSREISAIILPEPSPIWRKRFRDIYDVHQEHLPIEYKREYISRAIVLSQNISSKHGEQEQTLWLEVVRDMVLETFVPPKPNGPLTYKNLNRFREVLFNSEFLNRPVRGDEESFGSSHPFYAIQLFFTYLALDPSMGIYCLRTDYDIMAIYDLEGQGVPRPFGNIHSLWLGDIMHFRNFWVRHLLNSSEATFCPSYMSLPSSYRPKAPRSLTTGISELSPDWVGYVSCLCFGTDGGPSSRQSCADLGCCLEEVVPLVIRVEKLPNTSVFPQIFGQFYIGEESHRTYFRGTQTYYRNGGYINGYSIPVRGFIEQILDPQGGIPGWRRICFVMYEVEYIQLFDEGDEPAELDAPWNYPGVEFTFAWTRTYEGLILPGGRIMLGQWEEGRGKGPFIFWDVPNLA